MAIRTALLSVSDKSGLVPFAARLRERGIRLFSSGGTASELTRAGITVETIESLTGSPEMMGGRVKTLHPRVHGGILSRGAVDAGDLAKAGGVEIDLVVVNLYPFEQVAANPQSSREHIVENIDIGGPSMIRSAAKNHARVTVVCDANDYDRIATFIEAAGEVPADVRAELAAKAFSMTAAYDGAIASFLSRQREDAAKSESGEANSFQFSRYLTLPFEQVYRLRYGENPHQAGAFYRERGAPEGALANAVALGSGGKELSFNNIVDADAALEAVREFAEPAAVVVKHANPCGVATSTALVDAYVAARDADALSAFGGVVALNRPVDAESARAIAETFVECVVAPSFDEEALTILKAKRNLRLLATGGVYSADRQAIQYKRVGGGLVAQTADLNAASEVLGARVVTKRAPNESEMRALEFAWRVCKHVKSNAIVLAREGATVGVGAGQMSRVVSVQIACEKAGPRADGSVMASDAFFPFADGVETAVRAGVRAIVQPGGSVKDDEVIAAANASGVAMLFTGVRHFRH